MSKDLKTYAALVLSFLADANQRVRHAALGTLALFAEAFAGNSKSYANMYRPPFAFAFLSPACLPMVCCVVR